MQCISQGDFADFTAQLEGLTAVYQLNAEKKVKTILNTKKTKLIKYEILITNEKCGHMQTVMVQPLQFVTCL